MLIHAWDAALGDDEWRRWLNTTDYFGVLAVPNGNQAPVMVPTHFTLAGQELLLHLAKPNEALVALEQAEECALTVIGDYAYVPSHWRAKVDGPPENGVPTSYYAAVNFVCRPTVIHDKVETVRIVAAQMHHMQPEGGHGEIDAETGPYAAMLSGVLGVRLEILRVEAKFKYDDQKPVELRESIAAKLDARNSGLDAQVAATQRSRIAEIGDWSSFNQPR